MFEEKDIKRTIKKLEEITLDAHPEMREFILSKIYEIFTLTSMGLVYDEFP